MRRLTALALVLVCLTPCAGLAQETVEADFEGGHWLYEDTAQGVRVEIVRHEDTENRVLWYEADLVCGEDSPLRFLTANEDAPGKGFWYPERLAREKRAVFAINDDQFGHRVYNHDTVGVIVRGGEVLSERTRKSGSRGWPPLDTAAFFPDGSMRVFESAEHTGEEYVQMGAETVLAFGPWLVRGGRDQPRAGNVLPHQGAAHGHRHDRAVPLCGGVCGGAHQAQRRRARPVAGRAHGRAGRGGGDQPRRRQDQLPAFHGHEDQPFQPRRAGARRAQRVGPDRAGRERSGAGVDGAGQIKRRAAASDPAG